MLSGKVLFGLLVFVALVTFPIWFNGVLGRPGEAPDLVYPDPAEFGTECVRDTEYMTDSHMDLLNEWRDQVVRHGRRIDESPDGRRFVMSMSRTCMGCHQSKANFCDRCHGYLEVSPYCWECHVEPEESL